MSKVETMTIGEAKERLAEAEELRGIMGSQPVSAGAVSHPWVGKAVFVRSVTFHYIGRVVEVNGEELVLEDASWIAEGGRFTETLRDGLTQKVIELEPYKDQVRLNRAAVIDWTLWGHELPRDAR